MAGKTTHFGRAGEFFAMSELLLRGWNVAVPVVDVGDDVFVIDDNDKTTYRLQIKSAEAEETSGIVRAKFTLSRMQLRTPQGIELFYLFLARVSDRWRFVLVPREELAGIRDKLEVAPRSGPGRPPVSDSQARTDDVSFTIEIDDTGASGWSAALDQYLDQWPKELPPLFTGPGARKQNP